MCSNQDTLENPWLTGLFDATETVATDGELPQSFPYPHESRDGLSRSSLQEGDDWELEINGINNDSGYDGDDDDDNNDGEGNEGEGNEGENDDVDGEDDDLSLFFDDDVDGESDNSFPYPDDFGYDFYHFEVVNNNYDNNMEFEETESDQDESPEEWDFVREEWAVGTRHTTENYYYIIITF